MPALSRSYGGLRCIQLHSRAWPSLSRTTPLLPDTQTDPEQGKKTCVYLEVNKTLSLKSSFSLHQPCCLLPLCSTVDTLARSLCSKCVTNSSSTGQFCFKASAHVVSARSSSPPGPSLVASDKCQRRFSPSPASFACHIRRGILFPPPPAH